MKKTINLVILIIIFIMYSLSTISVVQANGSYTLTINNEENGHTYTIYQIFKGDPNGDTLSNVQLGKSVEETSFNEKFESLDSVLEKLSANENDYAKTFAKEVSKIVTTSIATLNTQSDGKYEIDGLEGGYYLIKDSVSGNIAVSDYMLKVVGNATIEAKASTPTATKTFSNNNTGASFSLGDTVEYIITGTLPSNYESYETYKYIIHDTQSKGLTLNTNSIKVYVDDVEIKDGFQVNTSGLSNNETFEVRFDNLKNITSVTSESIIKVKYTSTVNDLVEVGSAGNANTMVLEFSNNPNENTTTTKLSGITSEMYLYNININKVDGQGEELDGAEFKLEKLSGTSNEDAKEINKDTLNSNAHTFIFSKLGDGTYRLTETKTPEGYDTISPIEFTVSSSYTGATLTSIDIEVTSGNAVFSSDVDNGIISADIVNVEGSNLPFTGGVGTVIITIVGIAIIILAIILLIKNNRK